MMRGLRVYERSMRLYPREFRARFGSEMLQAVADQQAAEGRLPATRLFGDLLVSGIVQRWEESKMKPKIGVLAVTAVVLFLITRVVVGSGFTWRTGAIVGAEIAFIGLVIGAASLLGRRTRGAEHDYAVRTFRWWWVPAGLIGAFQGLAMLAQLIHEPKKEHVFALALFGGFSALVFGGMAVHNRHKGNLMIAAGVLPMLPMFWWYAPPLVSLLVIVMALSDNVRMSRPRVAV